jgi:hypothetical protein
MYFLEPIQKGANLVSSSILPATRSSVLSSYRLVCGIWIGFSLLIVVTYFKVAWSGGRIPQGRLFASALLLQAIGIPLYVWLKEFTSLTEAVIRSASAAAAFDGLAASILGLTGNRFGTMTSPGDLDPLQLGYIATSLLLGGLAGGTALGILRWRILQAQPVQPATRPLDSWRGHYLRSGLLWTAPVTVYYWLISTGRWATGHSDSRSFIPYVVPWAAAGLLLIVPIPILSLARKGEGRQKTIWRYWKYSIGVLFVALGLASPILMGIWFMYFPLAFLVYATFFLPPLLTWAVLYVCSAPNVPPDHRLSSYQPVRLVRPGSKIVWWSVAGQAAALLAGLLATVQISLGSHGIGCRNVSSADVTEYWFWKAYKGFGSEVSSGSRMILHLAVDSSVCMSLDQQGSTSISNPRLISDGYVAAARAWSWLIDPKQWDSERTRQIRQELTRLIGRDFSSYEELEEWWKQNNRKLVWSGKDQLLEVREMDLRDLLGFIVLENQDAYQLHQFDAQRFVAQNRLTVPWIFGPKPIGDVSGYPEFTALYFDREARSRELKLDAADLIAILSGEQQRRIQEYLHDHFKEDFSTKEEWQKFFAQIPRPYPWHMTRSKAEEWVGTLHAHWQNRYVTNLQAETGLDYSRLEDFVIWLQNPENTRGEEWERGEQVLRAYDSPEPFSNKRLALDWLKLITGQTFDLLEDWAKWWQQNRSNLVLSEDGQKLVNRNLVLSVDSRNLASKSK